MEMFLLLLCVCVCAYTHVHVLMHTHITGTQGVEAKDAAKHAMMHGTAHPTPNKELSSPKQQ